MKKIPATAPPIDSAATELENEYRERVTFWLRAHFDLAITFHMGIRNQNNIIFIQSLLVDCMGTLGHTGHGVHHLNYLS